MGEVKKRDYLFDTFRGLLICSIPLSHFTRVGGEFLQGSLGGIIYITINVFVMQAFVFLSGYFSKNPDKARMTAFKTFLFPYIIFTLVFYGFRYFYFGNANLTFLTPPFALWFLFSLFFYRFLMKDLLRIRFLLPLSILLYLLAGQVTQFGEYLALGRTMSYFTFFVMGYYCTKERIEWIKNIKTWKCLALLVVLIAVSYVLAFHVRVPVGFYLLKVPAAQLNLLWYEDIIMRVLVLFLSVGWTIVMLNLLPKSNNYLTYIGKNTMPIYIFHLFVRYIVKDHGFYAGNALVYYLSTWGLAALCIVIFSSPPVAKAYDKSIDFLYEMLMKLKKVMILPEKESTTK